MLDNKKSFFFFIVFFIGMLTHLSAQETLFYQETRGKIVTQNIWVLTPTESNYLHIEGNNAVEYASFLVKNNNTYYWQERRFDSDTQFEMTRTNDYIQIDGIVHGQKFNKQYPIDSTNHWIQALGVSLAPFILSDQDQLVFQLFSIKEKKFLEMQVIKKEPTVLMIDSQEIPAVTVWFTPTGWKSRFWKAILHFSTETGYILRYDGLAGKPGSDKLYIEWLNPPKEAISQSQ
tara:strand:- start:147 stop:842 length:696 start_codon:yes stop_codon:yes gene_type:complete